jgi:hypothetical protein
MSHTYVPLVTVAAEVRNMLKAMLPDYKFSVTKSSNQITIALMAAPVNVFVDEGPAYHQVNHYYLKNDGRLNEAGILTMEIALGCLKRFHWDESDIQSDYFNCSFYIHMSVGQWDKPFVVKERK